jgi:hypothetical protein
MPWNIIPLRSALIELLVLRVVCAATTRQPHVNSEAAYCAAPPVNVATTWQTHVTSEAAYCAAPPVYAATTQRTHVASEAAHCATPPVCMLQQCGECMSVHKLHHV